MADAAAKPAADETPVAKDGGDDAAATEPVEDPVEEPVVEVPKPDPITPEILSCHLKIAAAFRVFDHENNNTIDARYTHCVTFRHTPWQQRREAPLQCKVVERGRIGRVCCCCRAVRKDSPLLCRHPV